MQKGGKYRGQSPSLLTDLYSQRCFLNEVAEYDCPLAIVGKTETPYVQKIEVPFIIQYYKIAEYIYTNYRPLVEFGEFVIWCEKDLYENYSLKLAQNGFEENGYVIVDYGYDATISYIDEEGNKQYEFKPYHSYDIGMIPYIWANYDDYDAISSTEMVFVNCDYDNCFSFAGSQTVLNEQGNYLAFECTSINDKTAAVEIVLQDSVNEGARFQYRFRVVPGINQYIIRVSADAFWNHYNIDKITFDGDSDFTIRDVRILEGD